MLGGELAVLQASVFDGLALDPFALFEIGWGPAEVGVGWRHVVQALVVTLMVVVRDKGGDLGLEFAGQEVVFEQDEVLESLIVVAGGFNAERYFWPVAYAGRDGMTLEEVPYPGGFRRRGTGPLFTPCSDGSRFRRSLPSSGASRRTTTWYGAQRTPAARSSG